MKGELVEGLERTLRGGRDLMREAGVQCLTVVAVKPTEDSFQTSATIYGSPECLVAAASYLLWRVAQDARHHLDEPGVADNLARVEAAMAALDATVDDADAGARH